jgi:hypothetical protein
MQTKTMSIKDLETEAASVARALKNQGVAMENLYVPGESRGITKEQAFARMLEANPEVYAAYRDQHNARTLIRTLKAAGIRLDRQ